MHRQQLEKIKEILNRIMSFGLTDEEKVQLMNDQLQRIGIVSLVEWVENNMVKLAPLSGIFPFDPLLKLIVGQEHSMDFDDFIEMIRPLEVLACSESASPYLRVRELNQATPSNINPFYLAGTPNPYRVHYCNKRTGLQSTNDFPDFNELAQFIYFLMDSSPEPAATQELGKSCPIELYRSWYYQNKLVPALVYKQCMEIPSDTDIICIWLNALENLCDRLSQSGN